MIHAHNTREGMIKEHYHHQSVATIPDVGPV